MDLLVAALGGAGIIIFCESEYDCFRLFKKRKTLFFFVSQLTILSSVFMSVWNIMLYFKPDLRTLTLMVVSAIAKCVHDINYPVMMLLRLRIIRKFSVIIMYMPVMLAIMMSSLRFFNVLWFITGKRYYLNILFIVMPIITFTLTMEYVVINIFFIIVAIKHFDEIIRIRYVIIINIIVMILEGAGGEVLFLFAGNWKWAVLCILSIIVQIEVRLEVNILSYIKESVESNRERLINDEY